MIATFESFDELVAEAALQARNNAVLANDTARRYMDDVRTANTNQFIALDALQQTFLRSMLDIQSASFQLSRTVLDAASSLNRAVERWVFAVVFPWSNLTPLTETALGDDRTWMAGSELDEEASEIGDTVMSALRFQGPMGSIASGMGELDG